MDPFTTVKLRKRGSKADQHHKHSATAYDTVDPVFDETYALAFAKLVDCSYGHVICRFEFKVHQEDLRDLMLIVKMKDAIKYKWLAGKPTLGKVRTTPTPSHGWSRVHMIAFAGVPGPGHVQYGETCAQEVVRRASIGGLCGSHTLLSGSTLDHRMKM